MGDLAEAIERTKARGEQLVSERETAAKRNRERYPEFAAFVDSLRAVFGEVTVRRFKVLK